MKCPYCKEIIDNDSLFCDQCGKELKFCPECGVPKRGTVCPVCGEILVDGKQFFDAEKPFYLVGEGMKLELKEGVFGRKGGIYPEFSACIFVSGRHGEFIHNSEGWTVTDLGSTNGTCLNGARIHPNTPYPLKKGDILKVSRLTFTIE